MSEIVVADEVIVDAQMVTFFESGAQLIYIRSDLAWYARANRIDRPTLSVVASYSDGGCDWEFELVEYDLNGPSLRVNLFYDAFAAFAQLSEFFRFLAEAQPRTLAEAQEWLDEYGAEDRTVRVSPYGPQSED